MTRMKDQVELFTQYYNIRLSFQKLLLLMEVRIFPLTEEMRNQMKGLINFQDEDNE